jgi:hypothetical protein
MMGIATYQTITLDASTQTGTFPASEGLPYSGGEKTFAIYGTWGGATVKIEAAFDDGTTAANFIPLSDSEGAQLAFIDNAVFRLVLGQCRLQFKVSGSTSATSLSVKVS